MPRVTVMTGSLVLGEQWEDARGNWKEQARKYEHQQLTAFGSSSLTDGRGPGLLPCALPGPETRICFRSAATDLKRRAVDAFAACGYGSERERAWASVFQLENKERQLDQ